MYSTDHRSLILSTVVGIGEIDEAVPETEASHEATEREAALFDEPTVSHRTSLQDICPASGCSSSDITERRHHDDELMTTSTAAEAKVAPSRDSSEQCTAVGDCCVSCGMHETDVGGDNGEVWSADCQSILLGETYTLMSMSLLPWSGDAKLFSSAARLDSNTAVYIMY